MVTKELESKALTAALVRRETTKAENMMRASVGAAQCYFDKMNK